jgi:hypothetical protein
MVILVLYVVKCQNIFFMFSYCLKRQLMKKKIRAAFEHWTGINGSKVVESPNILRDQSIRPSVSGMCKS